MSARQTSDGGLASRLERLYRLRNHPRYVAPDPLAVVRRFSDPADLEVSALLTASLAYGRVAQINASLEDLLRILGPPARYAADRPLEAKRRDLAAFRHRFSTGADVACLLEGAGRVLAVRGSLGASLEAHDDGSDTVERALQGFVTELQLASAGSTGFLLADPARGSACKRWHLLLRWMVRRDSVDVGSWSNLGCHRLLVPVDTHMHRIGIALGFTSRRSADAGTVREVTAGFRRIAPKDPVRYDFVLTRSAIQEPDLLQEILGTGSRDGAEA